MTNIGPQTRKRIERAVRRVERLPIGTFGSGDTVALPGDAYPVLLFATEDIEHNAVGSCKIAKGSSASVAVDSDDTARKVINTLGRKIWSGSLLLASWASWRQDGDIEPHWIAQRAWSATQLRGTSTSAIATGASGALSSVEFLDGSGPSSVSIYNPGGEVAAGASVSGILVWTGSVSRWEVLAPGVGAAGGGGTAISLSCQSDTAQALAAAPVGVPTHRINILGSTTPVGNSLTGVSVSADTFYFGSTAETGLYLFVFGASFTATAVLRLNAVVKSPMPAGPTTTESSLHANVVLGSGSTFPIEVTAAYRHVKGFQSEVYWLAGSTASASCEGARATCVKL